MSTGRVIPGDRLIRVFPLSAMVVLALNDHVWKELYTGWWTGKLSDFAGLFLFPIALVAMCEWVRWLRRVPNSAVWVKRTGVWTASFVTGLVFSAINLSSLASDFYTELVSWTWSLGGLRSTPTIVNVSDPSDLIALPMLVLSARWMNRQRRRNREQNAQPVHPTVPPVTELKTETYSRA